MTPKDMIKEWRKGCMNAISFAEDGSIVKEHPWTCQACTVALIDAIERYEKAQPGLFRRLVNRVMS